MDLLLRIKHACGIKTVVETGTGFGCDADWFGFQFEKVYTVEIQPNLAHRSRTMFRGRNVEVLQGEAAKVLPTIASRIPRTETALYFFNAYRSDKPILVDELRAVLQSHPRFVVLINEICDPERPEAVYYKWNEKHQLTMQTVARTLNVCSPGWKSAFLEPDPEAKYQIGRLIVYPAALELNVI